MKKPPLELADDAARCTTNELSMRAGEQPRERLVCCKGSSRNIDMAVTGTERR
jgi:hypothetical protein